MCCGSESQYIQLWLLRLFLLPGKNPTDEYLEAMMNEAPGPINFTMFLTMFGEKLNGTDPEDVIRNAFACFDEEGTGETETRQAALFVSMALHQCCQEDNLLFGKMFLYHYSKVN